MRDKDNPGFLIVFLFPWALLPGASQGESVTVPTVSSIEDSLIARFNRVEDYAAEVQISVDMPRVRIPSKRVEVFYKRPDRVKVEAEGFAVVPRTGLALSPMDMINDLFEPRVVGPERVEGRTVWIVEGDIHPDSMEFDLFDHGPAAKATFSMRVQIDTEGWFVSRVETVLDTLTVMEVESVFQEYEGDIWLPELTELRFFVAGEFLDRLGDGEPMSRRGGIGEEHRQMGPDGQKDLEGRVRLEYSNYRINQGLEDLIFQEDE